MNVHTPERQADETQRQYRERQATPTPEATDWCVTYFNVGTEKRHALIDNIDEATADKVVERFGDNGDKFHRMPQVRKERMGSAA